ncbi:MAG: nox 2 [Acidimicrobiia bacterium]|nr:nox 2 [Acidimicrobiia bacterium]
MTPTDPLSTAPPVADLWDTMRTTRAFRSFKDQPVDDALLGQCLEAATWAPSGGNQQPWRFVVLRSPESRRALALGAERALSNIAVSYKLDKPAPDDDSKRARMARALYSLHEGAADVPAAVMFCARPLPLMERLQLGSNIYPAMQNFLLAARASGLGTLVTGWHQAADAELRATVGVPAEWDIAALVIVGWPTAKFGPVRRKPVAEVTALDTWDQPLLTAGEPQEVR